MHGHKSSSSAMTPSSGNIFVVLSDNSTDLFSTILGSIFGKSFLANPLGPPWEYDGEVKRECTVILSFQVFLTPNIITVVLVNKCQRFVITFDTPLCIAHLVSLWTLALKS
jgi:hypothetical protein